jgi:hypothetical protein
VLLILGLEPGWIGLDRWLLLAGTPWQPGRSSRAFDPCHRSVAGQDSDVDRPETRFVWNGESALAYQVLGEGNPELVYLPGPVSNVEMNWEHPTMSRYLHGRQLS